jgi:hypothetical protein
VTVKQFLRLAEKSVTVTKIKPSTLIVANGFSCQEQIVQGAGRPAIHLAELLQLGLKNSGLPIRADRC